MAHTCHATGCSANVPPEMWGCRRHWFMVPPAIRARVWQHYRAGQEEDWEPSREYLEAARDAVIAVAEREGRAPDTRVYDQFLSDLDGEGVTDAVTRGITEEVCIRALVRKSAAQEANEKAIARRARQCVHFNGLPRPCVAGVSTDDPDKRCEVGISYRGHVGGPDAGWAMRIPCFPRGDFHDQRQVDCSKFEETGLERAQADHDRREKRMAESLQAIHACHAHAEANEVARGQLECPICEEGSLTYVVRGPAKRKKPWVGHMWGACSTEGCVSWIR